MGMGGGGSYQQSYRLDDLWLVECCFTNSDNKLFLIRLYAFLRSVWVPPCPHFTGVWVTYFLNGQKSHEIHYKDGLNFWEFTSFRPDGSKCVVQHYNSSGCDGEDTGYYPSGKINYRGCYKSGKQVGTWTWYNEDGSVKSTQDHSHDK